MSKEPIAIIGIGCRLPGNINNPKAFWEVLASGDDGITAVPEDRWSIRRFYGGPTPHAGKIISRFGGFIQGIDQFDAEFFGIPAKEAAQTDPQHRLMLEVAWEALEDAGLVVEELAGSQTGVFMGISGTDYALLQLSHLSSASSHANTGSKHYMAANRISYAFDLNGPSVALDAACATSLVAVDLACQNLWQQRCPLALVGGVNLQLAPQSTVSFSQFGTLAPDGRCKPFDARANGYVRSDAAVVVVLKPLSAAQHDGDAIYAVIRATATNHGGHNQQGWMVPRQEAQGALLSSVYAEAGISAADVSYIEAHGTGTVVGDRVETAAIGSLIQGRRDPEQPLYIGSVKSNLGHCEAGAGITGLTKVALMLQHRKIVPNLHFEHPNPNIPFQQLGLRVPQQLEDFPAYDKPLVAGVSSFGVGGSNAHVILEEFIHREQEAGHSVTQEPSNAYLIPVSARHPVALKQTIENYLGHLETTDDSTINLDELSHTLSNRRTHHHYRMAFVAESIAELRQQLEQRVSDPFAFLDPPPIRTKPKLAFVFSGLGSQWWGMGRELLEREPVFRESLEAFDALWYPTAGWSLLEEMRAPETATRIGVDTQVSMLATHALQIALAQLWFHWGIVPDVIVGHSTGEVAAAHAAGGINLEQVIQLAHARLQCVSRVQGKGTMVAVGLPVGEIEPVIRNYSDRITIAAINSHQSLTLAGDVEAVQAVAVAVEQTGAFCRVLNVDAPFHGLALRQRHTEFSQLFPEVTPATPVIPYVSTVTGRVLDIPLDKDYWLRNFEQTVHFSDAIASMIDMGLTTFVELGSHPVLGYSMTECLRVSGIDKGDVLPTLRREEPEQKTALQSLATLYTLGYTPRWQGVCHAKGRHLRLPTYPWQKQSYWNESLYSRQLRLEEPQHPLLGKRHSFANNGHQLIWENTLYPILTPYLEDHRIQGKLIFPGAAYLEMIYAALSDAFPTESHELSNVEFHRALFLREDSPIDLQVAVDLLHHTFGMYSTPEREHQPWTLHASGSFVLRAETVSLPREKLATIRNRDLKVMDTDEFYQQKWNIGYEFGPGFKTLRRIEASSTEALVEVALPDAFKIEDQDYGLHPLLIDGILQAASTVRPVRTKDRLLLPVGVECFRVYAKLPHVFWVHVQSREEVGGVNRYDLTCLDAEGNDLAQIVGYTSQVVQEQSGGFSWNPEDWLFEESWQCQALEGTEDDTLTFQQGEQSYWLIFADEGGLAEFFAQHGVRAGANCMLVTAGRQVQTLDVPLIECMDMISSQKADFVKLFKELLSDARTCRGIVYLRTLDSESVPLDMNRAADEFPREDCSRIAYLLQGVMETEFVQQQGVIPRLYLVTRNACTVEEGEKPSLLQAPVWGLGRVVMSEHPQFDCTLIDLGRDDMAHAVESLWTEIASLNQEHEVVWRGQQRYVCRVQPHRITDVIGASILPAQLAESHQFSVMHDDTGDLDSLYLQELLPQPIASDEVQIRVCTAALNFRDVMKAIGIYPTTTDDHDQFLLGDECAGEVIAVGDQVQSVCVGDAVIAHCAGSLSSVVTVPETYVFRAPESMSLADAATVPVVFTTVIYAFGHVGHLRKGEKVLIHSAAGGIGLAAVQYAQHLGAEIFATAGSEDKRAYLRSLGIKHVLDSHSLEFTHAILKATAQQGVDVILNSLAGPAIPASLSLLGAFGRFIELGKRDIYEDTHIGLSPFKNNLSYHAIDMSRLWRERPEEGRALVQEVLRHFESGVFRPLPRTTFPVREIRQAFRYMAQGRHTGKIVVNFPDEALEVVPVRHDQRRLKEVLHANATYLVTGGLGGFGLLLADWMVKQGARHLVLMGRQGVTTGAQRAAVQALKQQGAEIVVAQGHVEQEQDVRATLDAIKRSAFPLKGVIHAAGVLDDAALVNTDEERFATVMAPKIRGSWNLHCLTKHSALDFFVLFSSAAVTDGNPGQANYVAANRFLDMLAHHRRAEGLTATSINWGALADTGYSFRQGFIEHFADKGQMPYTPSEATELFGKFLQYQPTQVIVKPMDWNKYLATHNADEIPRRFAQLVDTFREQEAGEHRERPSLRTVLASMASEQAEQCLFGDLCQTIGRIRGISAATLTPESAFDTLGLDSLMGVELINWIRYELGVSIAVMAIYGDMTIANLARHIIEDLKKSK
jgi:acyl transferase domain-containing protein/acyl carrier protein